MCLFKPTFAFCQTKRDILGAFPSTQVRLNCLANFQLASIVIHLAVLVDCPKCEGFRFSQMMERNNP